MDDGERLLEAVLTAQDDDAPRRVYADWLVARGGDPVHAELIQVQCDLAALDQESDDPELRARWWALRDREEPLLAEYTPRWLAGFRRDVADVRFSRGFPHWVAVERDTAWAWIPESTVRGFYTRSDWLPDAPAMPRIESLRVQDREHLLQSPEILRRTLPALRRLEVDTEADILDADVRGIVEAWSSSLIGLSLEPVHMSLDTLDLDELRGLSHLVELGLNGAEPGAPAALSSWPHRLTSLRLGIDGGGEADELDALLAARICRDLVNLELWWPEGEALDVAHLHRLRRLQLWSFDPTTVGALQLPAGLRELAIWRAPEQTLELLAGKRLDRLEVLELGFATVHRVRGPDDQVPGFPALRRLRR